MFDYEGNFKRDAESNKSCAPKVWLGSPSSFHHQYSYRKFFLCRF